MNDPFDCEAWQVMLDREDIGVTSLGIGLLRREDFQSRHGTLLVWRGGTGGMRAIRREYRGQAGDDVAILLVADGEAIETLRSQGLSAIGSLSRRGRLHAYMMKSPGELASAGLAGLVEDMGLAFPRH
jgi:hypothetical protein